MYHTHLEVKPSKTGSGVFTKIQIPAKKPIIEFTGDIIPKDKLVLDQSQFLQIGQDRFMGPSGAIDDYINHSCDPNCYLSIVGNRALLYSLYVIPKGSELTFDYSTSSTDTLDSWQMPCKCGAYKCRKIISGYPTLSEDIKKDYVSKKMVPVFITNPNFYQKKW